MSDRSAGAVIDLTGSPPPTVPPSTPPTVRPAPECPPAPGPKRRRLDDEVSDGEERKHGETEPAPEVATQETDDPPSSGHESDPETETETESVPSPAYCPTSPPMAPGAEPSDMVVYSRMSLRELREHVRAEVPPSYDWMCVFCLGEAGQCDRECLLYRKQWGHACFLCGGLRTVFTHADRGGMGEYCSHCPRNPDYVLGAAAMQASNDSDCGCDDCLACAAPELNDCDMPEAAGFSG